MINFDLFKQTASFIQEGLKDTVDAFLAENTSLITEAASSAIESVKDSTAYLAAKAAGASESVAIVVASTKEAIIEHLSTNIDIKPLDLAYGLNKQRDVFLKSILGTNVESELNKHRINRLNNLLLNKILIKLKIEKEFEVETSPEIEALSKEFQAFYEIFYGRMLDEFSIKSDVILIENNLGKAGFISRHCKIGIIWNICHNRNIYYVLDGFNLNGVFDKSHKDSKGYSASEVRFIYRLFQSRVLTDEQKSMVKFVKSGSLYGYKEVPAPWESDPSIVGRYVPRNRKRSWQLISLAGR